MKKIKILRVNKLFLPLTILAFGLSFTGVVFAAQKTRNATKQATSKKSASAKAKFAKNKSATRNIASVKTNRPVRGQLLVMDKNGKNRGIYQVFALDRNHIAVRFNEDLPPLTLASFKYRANFFGKRSFFTLKALDARINLAVLGTKTAIQKVSPDYAISNLNPKGQRDLEILWPRLVRLKYRDGDRLPSSTNTPESVIRESLARAQTEVFTELSQGTKAVKASGFKLASVPEDSNCIEVSGSKGTLPISNAESFACRSSVVSPLGRSEKLFWTVESGVYTFDSAQNSQSPDPAVINNVIGSKYFDELRLASESSRSKHLVCDNFSLSTSGSQASYCTRNVGYSKELFDTVVVVSHQEPNSQLKYSVIRLSGLNIDYTKKTMNTFIAAVVPNFGGH